MGVAVGAGPSTPTEDGRPDATEAAPILPVIPATFFIAAARRWVRVHHWKAKKPTTKTNTTPMSTFVSIALKAGRKFRCERPHARAGLAVLVCGPLIFATLSRYGRHH